MDAEIAAYDASIAGRLERVCELVRGLSAEQLNRKPVDGGNSMFVLATHTAGNARAWIVGIAAGQALRRDRPAEFAAAGDDAAALIAGVEAIARDVHAAAAGIDPARLGVRFTPARELWGEGEPYEISVREAFLHVIEHASIHVGHMQLTRELVAA